MELCQNDDKDEWEVVWKGRSSVATLNGLDPGCYYKLRLHFHLAMVMVMIRMARSAGRD